MTAVMVLPKNCRNCLKKDRSIVQRDTSENSPGSCIFYKIWDNGENRRRAAKTGNRSAFLQKKLNLKDEANWEISWNG